MGIEIDTAAAAQETLSLRERERLDYLEERIADGLEVFRMVGMDLMEIRDTRLYRAEYGTFEAYCRSRWNLDRGYAYELIGATAIAKELSGIPDTPLPTAVAQVRPLTKLKDPADRAAAWQEAVAEANGKPVTAALVRKVVEKRAPSMMAERKPSRPVADVFPDADQLMGPLTFHEWAILRHWVGCFWEYARDYPNAYPKVNEVLWRLFSHHGVDSKKLERVVIRDASPR